MISIQLISLALTFIVAGGGAYFGAYLRRKGENLATHEDLDKVLVQVREVTKVTKDIEAQISDQVWERQRKWEMKRDAVMEAMKVIGDVEIAMSILLLTHTGEPSKSPTKEEAGNMWNEALGKFKRSRILASLVCSNEVDKAFVELEEFMIQSIRSISQRDLDTLSWFPQFRSRLYTLIDVVRNDLASRSH